MSGMAKFHQNQKIPRHRIVCSCHQRDRSETRMYHKIQEFELRSPYCNWCMLQTTKIRGKQHNSHDSQWKRMLCTNATHHRSQQSIHRCTIGTSYSSHTSDNWRQHNTCADWLMGKDHDRQIQMHRMCNHDFQLKSHIHCCTQYRSGCRHYTSSSYTDLQCWCKAHTRYYHSNKTQNCKHCTHYWHRCCKSGSSNLHSKDAAQSSHSLTQKTCPSKFCSCPLDHTRYYNCHTMATRCYRSTTYIAS